MADGQRCAAQVYVPGRFTSVRCGNAAGFGKGEKWCRTHCPPDELGVEPETWWEVSTWGSEVTCRPEKVYAVSPSGETVVTSDGRRSVVRDDERLFPTELEALAYAREVVRGRLVRARDKVKALQGSINDYDRRLRALADANPGGTDD